MPNPFVHIELNTREVDRSKKFYSAMFDWKLEDVPAPGGGGYTLIQVGEGTGGGMWHQPAGEGPPPSWLPYVLVDDIKAATEKARSLGAKIMREPMEVMDEGWLSIFVDPNGAALGLWQPKKKSP
jgi:predicted enzyme related to lactoylglutathione lyase